MTDSDTSSPVGQDLDQGGIICTTGGPLTPFTPKEQNRYQLILRRCFKGAEQPRQHQEMALRALVKGHHTCVIAGTASGKSRIQLLAICWALQEDKEALMVVIQPTKALAVKQVEQFKKRRPSLHPTWYDTTKDILDQRQSIEKGRHKIIILSPEVASGEWFKTVVRKTRFRRHLHFVTIDEAHLIQVWVEFRAYSWLCEMLMGKARCLLTTATLTLTNEKNVYRALGLRDVFAIRCKTHRPNLYVRILDRPGDGPLVDPDRYFYLQELVDSLIEHRLDSTRILFIGNSMGKAENFYGWWKEQLGDRAYVGGPSVGPQHYTRCMVQLLHSETPNDEREFILNTFMDGKGVTRHLFATSLAELGIDYKNLLQLVQLGPPSTMSQMIQAWGRLGRDGRLTLVTILANTTDLARCTQDVKDFIHNKDTCLQKMAFKMMGEDIKSSAPCCPVCLGETSPPNDLQGLFQLSVRKTPVTLEPPSHSKVRAFTATLRSQPCEPPMTDPLIEMYTMAFKSGERFQNFQFMSETQKPAVLQALVDVSL